ncbi:MAG: DUF1289 domain-containing protein [Pseudomonadota bacterium]|jgi:predicted Fe-S protein YdhL (DUF1289 family)
MSAAPPAPMVTPIVTPCVKVCFIDDASGLCLGCFRTLSEIGGWSGYTPADRARIMAELPDRRGRIAPEKLGEA